MDLEEDCPDQPYCLVKPNCNMGLGSIARDFCGVFFDLAAADPWVQCEEQVEVCQKLEFPPICMSMGSLAPAASGVADLLQLFSSAGSASVSAALSSPAVASALQHASSGDVAHLSLQALQLQEASGLFGSPGAPQAAASPESFLQAIDGSFSGATSGSATSASALVQAYSLFGNPTGGTGIGSISFLG